MAPHREKTFLLDEQTPITEEALKNFVDGVLDGTIAPSFKVLNPSTLPMLACWDRSAACLAPTYCVLFASA
jgi:hypothetical protein